MLFGMDGFGKCFQHLVGCRTELGVVLQPQKTLKIDDREDMTTEEYPSYGDQVLKSGTLTLALGIMKDIRSLQSTNTPIASRMQMQSWSLLRFQKQCFNLSIYSGFIKSSRSRILVMVARLRPTKLWYYWKYIIRLH